MFGNWTISRLCVITAISLAPTSIASAVTHRVPEAYPTIQAALDAADHGDVIRVGPGTYHEAIVVNKTVELHGVDGPQLTIIDATGLDATTVSCFGVGSDTLIRGFTITGGLGVEHSAGGMYLLQSSATVIDCRFEGNVGDYGSGVYAEWGYAIDIRSCVFRANIGTQAVGSWGVALTMSNCLIVENEGSGVGEFVGGGPMTLMNCTIANNTGFGIGPSNPQAVLTNCIVWGNGFGQIYETDPYDPVTVTYSDVQGGFPGEGNASSDPWFDFAGDYRLLPISPCIDSGSNAAAGPCDVDLDGNRQRADGDRQDTGHGEPPFVDMGAFEAQSTPADCNRNATLDDCELAAGMSQDLNSNEIPDECEQTPGDLNFDSLVDVDDLVLVIATWGPCPPPPGLCFGDATVDGVVDVDDLVLVMTNWS